MEELFKKLLDLNKRGIEVSIRSSSVFWSGFPFVLSVFNTNNSKSTSRLFGVDDVNTILDGIDQLVKEIE